MLPLTHQRGIALAVVLFHLVILTTVSATLFLTRFLDGESGKNDAAATEAFYAAEAGAHHVWALLAPAPDFAEALAWPGGQPPFGNPVWFPAPPRTYRVEVAAGPESTLLVRSEGTARGGARARVEASFRRPSALRPPAVLVLASGATAETPIGSLTITREDADGIEPPLPTVAAEDRAAGESLAAASGTGARIGPSGFGAAVDRLRGVADRTLAGPFGDESWDGVIRIATDGTVVGTVVHRGILLAETPLRVEGRLEVRGLLLAAAGLEVRGSLVVTGSAWVSEGLAVPGSARFDHSSAALGAADVLRPGILPRPAVLGAWRELW